VKQLQLTAANQKLRSLNEARVLVTEAEISHARASAKLDAVRENVRICRERLEAALVQEGQSERETLKLRAVAERMRESWLDNLRDEDEDLGGPHCTEGKNIDIAAQDIEARDHDSMSDLGSGADVGHDHQNGSQSESVLAPSPFTPRPLEQYRSPLDTFPLYVSLVVGDGPYM
jgi:hypothetical protein